MLRKLKIDFDLIHFLILGAAQGLAFHYIVEVRGDETWTPYFTAALMWTFIGPTMYFLTTTAATRMVSVIFSVAVASGLSAHFLIADSLVGGIDPNPEMPIVVASLGAAVISYISICFFRAGLEDGGQFHYPSLFKHAWNMPVVFAAAATFSSLFWMVLGLWGALFKLVEIDFFADLFTEEWFVATATASAVAVGIAIARRWEPAILTVRGVVIVLLRLLSPILAVVSIAFLITLIFTGLEKLWATDAATPIVLSVLILANLLIGAVIGAGDEEEEGERKALNLLARAQAIALPGFGAIAVYSLWLRIDQYGLTLARIYAGLIVIVATGYAIAYAVAALTPGWKERIERINIILALIIVATFLAVQSPLLNPYEISANSLVKRLETGRTSASEFDYGYMRFELGKSGEKALKRLVDDTSLADHDTIKVEVANLDGFETYYSWKSARRAAEKGVSLDPEDMVGTQILVRPEGHQADPGILDALSRKGEHLSYCGSQEDKLDLCYLVSINLIGDERSEYIWAFRSGGRGRINLHAYYFDDVKDKWAVLSGEFSFREAVSVSDEEAVLAALESGQFEALTITLQALKIGDSYRIFSPSSAWVNEHSDALQQNGDADQAETEAPSEPEDATEPEETRDP